MKHDRRKEPWKDWTPTTEKREMANAMKKVTLTRRGLALLSECRMVCERKLSDQRKAFLCQWKA